MTKTYFWKIEAAGNDFILFDNRTGEFDNDFTKLAQRLCHRKYGIGADGIIFITEKSGFDFEMKYFNSDGTGPRMCGNGARAAILFVNISGICKKAEYHFYAVDGEHFGRVNDRKISLTIKKPEEIKKIEHDNKIFYFLQTGTRHIVAIRENIDDIDLDKYALKIRREYDTNVNYIEKDESGKWKIRTYERGVEGETLACGTGATAAAFVVVERQKEKFPVTFSAKGGDLTIDLSEKYGWLYGPTKKVFEGYIEL